jgi:hypothetical protein
MGFDKQQFDKVEHGNSIVKDLVEIRSMLKEAVIDLNVLFNSVLQHATYFRQPRSILEMAKSYEQPCDILVLAGKKDGLRYVSGHLNLCLSDGKFTCGADLYFQDNAGKWVVKKASSAPLASSYLTADAWAELQRAGKISFEVFDPETE